MLSAIPNPSISLAFDPTDIYWEHLSDLYAGALRPQTTYEDGPSIDPSLTLCIPTSTAESSRCCSPECHDYHSSDYKDAVDEYDEKADNGEESIGDVDDEDASGDEELVGHVHDNNTVTVILPAAPIARASPRPSSPSSATRSKPKHKQEAPAAGPSTLPHSPAPPPPPGRRSKRLQGKRTFDYSGLADEPEEEAKATKRRKPLSSVQTESHALDDDDAVGTEDEGEQSVASRVPKKTKENARPRAKQMWHCGPCDVSIVDDEKTRKRHVTSEKHKAALRALDLPVPEGESIKCPWCGKIFENCRPDSLLRHMRTACKKKPADYMQRMNDPSRSTAPSANPEPTDTTDAVNAPLHSVAPSPEPPGSPGPSEDSPPSSP